MKQPIVLFILLFALTDCNMNLEQNKSDHQKVEVNQTDKGKSQCAIQHNDSIQYRIGLDKVIYSPNEAIHVIILAKNISDHTINIWLDAGDYPTGTDLCLFNSKGISMVDQYWAVVSSQLHREEEVELLKTTLKPNQEVKKVYPLYSIVQLKENLTAGTYSLRYNNAPPCKFEVK
jgi:hypothetical protein